MIKFTEIPERNFCRYEPLIQSKKCHPYRGELTYRELNMELLLNADIKDDGVPLAYLAISRDPGLLLTSSRVLVKFGDGSIKPFQVKFESRKANAYYVFIELDGPDILLAATHGISKLRLMEYSRVIDYEVGIDASLFAEKWGPLLNDYMDVCLKMMHGTDF